MPSESKKLLEARRQLQEAESRRQQAAEKVVAAEKRLRAELCEFHGLVPGETYVCDGRGDVLLFDSVRKTGSWLGGHLGSIVARRIKKDGTPYRNTTTLWNWKKEGESDGE